MTVGDLQRAAVAAGLRYGVDLASRDSATLGGTVATNAGGLRVVRHGTTRAQVRGLEVVLADGRIASRLAPPPQDNAGLDLTDLLVGSEGTLAVVTAARVRLVPPEAGGYVTLVGCRDLSEAIGLLPATGLRAAEVMLAAGLDLVRRVAGLSQPLEREHPVYLLLETDELPDLPDDVDAAVDPALWAYRERHTEAIATLGVARKLDVSLPLRTLPDVRRRAGRRGGAATRRTCSATWRWATCTSTCSVSTTPTSRWTSGCSRWWPHTAAASPPSTASGWRSGSGSRSPGRRPRST